MYHVREIVTAKTQLGIRFWDPVLDRQIRDGLSVTAQRINNVWPTYTATRTKSDIYTFHALQTLYNGEDEPAEGSPPDSIRYAITVRDRRERFLPVAWTVRLPLPYTGMYLSQSLISPDTLIPSGFLLFSSPSRLFGTDFCLLRGTLFDEVRRQPAAHALLKVNKGDGKSSFGISDEAGRFVIATAYPVVDMLPLQSPFVRASRSSFDQTWDFDFEVLYAPAHRIGVFNSLWPDYDSILNQPAAEIWPVMESQGGTGMQQITVTVQYGRTFTFRTVGLDVLYVRSQDSSPPS